MQAVRSPLFPDASLALSPGRDEEPTSLIPQLPSQPLLSTSSLQIFLVTPEKNLYVQGFKPVEFENRPPTLLRGALVLRILKTTRIKSLSLTFHGTQRTEWPEGIPPKRNSYIETNDIVTHSWPFYHADSLLPNGGADMFVPAKKGAGAEEITHLSLDSQISPTGQPAAESSSFAASLIKRAASPLLPSVSANLSPVNSVPDLHAVLSSSSLNTMDSAKPGSFIPGDYIYNFEHPIPASTPETIQANFGSVNYYLEANLVRQTTFKSNLAARKPINIVRVPSDNSFEENEPIAIERTWDDQLRYEIVVASKSVVLDTYLPLFFKFTPLYDKLALHRIRVYITEDFNYFCHNKSVHRAEPSRKYLLLEHKAKKNMSLLGKNGGQVQETDPYDEVLPREMEFQLFVPSTVNKKYNYTIHADTAIENIQCDHWIKVSLRISKPDPENPGKRKHFEISIDSPIHLCSPLAAHQHTLLPVYSTEPEYLPRYTEDAMSPGVIAVEETHHNSSNSLRNMLNARQDGNGGSRTPPPLEFQHITSPTNSVNPPDPNRDFHLSSNLFVPESDEVLSALGSPQAQPYSPTPTPLMSPVRSPPAPSTEPPSFNTAGIRQDTLPPAYNAASSVSRSPVRLSVGGDSLDTSSSGSSIKMRLSRSLDNRGADTLASDSSSLKAKSIDSSMLNMQPLGEEEPQPVKKTVHDTLKLQNEQVPSSTDITDLAVPNSHSDEVSRKSSVVSSLSVQRMQDDNIISTIPLLGGSSSSINEQQSLFDPDQPADLMDSFTDLSAQAIGIEEFQHTNKLSSLFNSRLNKHYQTDNQNEEHRDASHWKPRQKSFGVMSDLQTYTSPQETLSGDETIIDGFNPRSVSRG